MFLKLQANFEIGFRNIIQVAIFCSRNRNFNMVFTYPHEYLVAKDFSMPWLLEITVTCYVHFELLHFR
ncbi:hypothetical protein [Chitinophaga sp. 212800010-3]|uniref:hypothetical protein n=1 Tax=unclassified Chitinophaga TaxID=2619133 RepID=UPI002DEF8731|nr:hypothetical protein [Chitinophaga sp. 212800010-3]